jgi:class 3 adenylate cyclase
MEDTVTSNDVVRKLTAIFSADVKGYSRLMGDDEVATIHTLASHRELMTAIIQQSRGRVIDSPGDNLLAEFASVVDAVQCAMDIQHKLKERNAELDLSRRMEFRIGVNVETSLSKETAFTGWRQHCRASRKLGGRRRHLHLQVSRTSRKQIAVQVRGHGRTNR